MERRLAHGVALPSNFDKSLKQVGSENPPYTTAALAVNYSLSM